MDEVNEYLPLRPTPSNLMTYKMEKDSIYYAGGLRLHRHQQDSKMIDDDFDMEEECSDPHPPPYPPPSLPRRGRSERQNKVMFIGL